MKADTAKNTRTKTNGRANASADAAPTPVVFVVDDDPAARNSLAALISSRGLAVKTFASADDFLDAYRPDQRACLIADVRMTGTSGLELQQLLAESGVNLPVIIITGFADVPTAIHAMRAGAVTFLEKPCSEQEISDAIQTALDIEQRTTELRQRRAEIEDSLSRLNDTERTILDKMVLGLTNQMMANDLNFSLRTIEKRRARIFEKMHAGSLAELLRMVLLVRPAGM
jgi:two-component system, LuxR family, response regulator FixJ